MTRPNRSPAHAVGESPRRADYVFTFSSEAYADASRRGMMRPPDRLLSTLIARARRCASCWSRTPTGPGPRPGCARCWTSPIGSAPPRPATSSVRCGWRAPTRSTCPGIERVYVSWDRAVRSRKADSLGIQSPRSSPPARWSPASPGSSGHRRAIYYARDDWVSRPPTPPLAGLSGGVPSHRRERLRRRRRLAGDHRPDRTQRPAPCRAERDRARGVGR